MQNPKESREKKEGTSLKCMIFGLILLGLFEISCHQNAPTVKHEVNRELRSDEVFFREVRDASTKKEKHPELPETLKCKENEVVCDKQCVNLSSNSDHCGQCQVSCKPWLNCSSSGTCLNGKCELICPIGQCDCGTKCVDLKYDRSNCGICGKRCKTTETCDNGKCKESN